MLHVQSCSVFLVIRPTEFFLGGGGGGGAVFVAFAG